MKAEIKRLSSLLQEHNGKIIVISDCRNNPDFDTFRDFHGTDILPDEYRYETIARILDRLQEYDFETVDEVYDNGMDHEIIDSLVEVYTKSLTSWLASRISRVYFCNEAREIGLSDGTDLVKTLQAGQYLEIQMIMNNILTYLRQHEA